MVSIYAVLLILIIHWVADFVLQTDQEAKGKSNNWKDLLSHTITYSIFWLVFTPFLGIQILSFILITFITHTIIDFYTSRVNSQLYKDGKTHQFFVSIGFDQLLHFTQLLLTYYILTK